MATAKQVLVHEWETFEAQNFVGTLNGTSHRSGNGVYYLLGEKMTSVTTILNNLAKPAVERWKLKKVGEYVAGLVNKLDTGEMSAQDVLCKLRDPDYIVKRAMEESSNKAEIGTSFHSAMEVVDSGLSIHSGMYSPEEWAYIQAGLNWRMQTPMQVLAIEACLISKTQRYAGTCDRIVRWNGKVCILDYKTGGVWPEYRMQLAAYKNAEYIVMPNKTEVVKMPKIDECHIVQVAPDGVKTHLQDTDLGWMVFEAALTIHRNKE